MMNTRLQTTRADSLMCKEFPPQRFLVQDILPEGLTILAGKPKIGKSWLALNIALATAQGSPVLGRRPADAGDVLYLALEDGERRLQQRLGVMLGLEPAPVRLSLATDCPALDSGGAAAINQWVCTADNPRLVIVDVFARIRAKQTGGRLYDDDYRASLPLKEIADRHAIAVMVLTHTRKAEAGDDPFDAVSATTGLTGAADHVVILDRKNGMTALYARGRDAPEIERALRFESAHGRWIDIGEVADVARSDQRNAILRVVREAGTPLGPLAIANAAKVSHDVVKQLVKRMAAAGDLNKEGRGQYTVPHSLPSPYSPPSLSPIELDIERVAGERGEQSEWDSAEEPLEAALGRRER